MKITKTIHASCGCVIFLLGVAITARAQSYWNYDVTDAGGGNSLVTWTVTGSLATAPGAVLVANDSSLPISVNAPGIFTDDYSGSGGNQLIPTPDGSYFQYNGGDVYTGLVDYDLANAGGGNDTFGFVAPLMYRSMGYALTYISGTQSVVIPVPYSDFNPGSYQSEDPYFSTPLTVNLAVGPVPEPACLPLFALGGIGVFRMFRQRSTLEY